MRVCCWCRTVIQARPATPYCETMGYFFSDNPWQCARGDCPKGGENQRMHRRATPQHGKPSRAQEKSKEKFGSDLSRTSAAAPRTLDQDKDGNPHLEATAEEAAAMDFVCRRDHDFFYANPEVTEFYRKYVPNEFFPLWVTPPPEGADWAVHVTRVAPGLNARRLIALRFPDDWDPNTAWVGGLNAPLLH